jgi:hypothetical protein
MPGTRVATPAVIAGENAKISDVVPEQPVKHKSAVLSPQRLPKNHRFVRLGGTSDPGRVLVSKAVSNFAQRCRLPDFWVQGWPERAE